MSDGFVRWYKSSSTAESFIRQVDRFVEFGIVLIHPSMQTAVILDIDGSGVNVELSEISSLIGRKIGRQIPVQWWFASDVDLTCTYTFLPGGREIQEFSLDGLTEEERSLVISVVRMLFDESPEGSIALVVDERGVSVDFDWDDYIVYEVGEPPVYSGVLVLCANT